MKETIDAITSYALAGFMLVFSVTIENAGTILQLGGILLLTLRLYADGKRALKTWRGEL